MAIPAQDIENAIFLSIAAYERTEVAVGGYLATEGWSRVDSVDVAFPPLGIGDIPTAGGAVAAISADATTLGIAFRGSDDPYVNDYRDALIGQSRHYSLFEEFVSNVRSFLSTHPSITKVLVTGHSLGGALAEIYVSRDAFAIDNVSLITFASPG